ncbi:MAG: phosphoribosyl-AMP cyclohydrolase, partial [Marinovum sp.]|nr:phosphoribosyl-AMP cyclohydrolase [Marinovum sp.]
MQKVFLKMSFDPASLSYNAAGLIPAIAQDETS